MMWQFYCFFKAIFATDHFVLEERMFPVVAKIFVQLAHLA